MKPQQTLIAAMLLSLLPTACSTFAPLGAPPALATVDDASRYFGPPAMRWTLPDGGTRLAFPQGPMGYRTWMVEADPAGQVRSVENVMRMEHFARIQPGLGKEEVLRILGPSHPGWTTYFPARNELVWEWRYCDVWSEPARFDVLFDATTGVVRSTLAQPERLSQPWGRGNRRDWCSP